MGWGEARCWAWIGASRQEEAGWKLAPTKDGGATRDGGAGVVRGERPGRPRRLREYDYAQDGAYSVTVCTDWRTHLFGRVTDGRMELNAVGGSWKKFGTNCRSITRMLSWMRLW